MSHLEAGSLDFGPLVINLSESVLRQRKPYTGPQWPASGAAPAALAAPAPAPQPVRISPAPDTAPTTLSADSVGGDQPDTCSLSFQQQNLWRKPDGQPWQGPESASKPARPGLSLAALERLRS